LGLKFNLEACLQSYREIAFQKNISFWCINISLRVIELRKKKGSYSAIFEVVKRKLFRLKFNLEACVQSYGEIATRKKYISLGHKHFAPVNRVEEK
jgi:hypothetical protein